MFNVASKGFITMLGETSRHPKNWPTLTPPIRPKHLALHLLRPAIAESVSLPLCNCATQRAHWCKGLDWFWYIQETLIDFVYIINLTVYSTDPPQFPSTSLCFLTLFTPFSPQLFERDLQRWNRWNVSCCVLLCDVIRWHWCWRLKAQAATASSSTSCSSGGSKTFWISLTTSKHVDWKHHENKWMEGLDCISLTALPVML